MNDIYEQIDKIITSLERWYDGDEGADSTQTRAKIKDLIAQQVKEAQADYYERGYMRCALDALGKAETTKLEELTK